MNLIPDCVIASKWRRAAAALDCGTLRFTAPDGEVTTFRGVRPGPSADFSVHSWDTFRLAVSRGDIGLGEAYIDGMWDSDDIESLVALFLLNMERLDGFADGNLLQRLGFVVANSLLRRNSLKGSARNIESHYDVGNDFYALWLDPSMTYSSALYDGAKRSLEQAQRSKYDRILERIAGHGASILEVGCGWGGFAERATDAGNAVTGLTISPAQHTYATGRLRNRSGEIRLEDYRKVRGSFDAIVSIEMFEAVGEHYWPGYFQTIAERLKRDGRAVIQTITIRDDLFAGYRRRSDFIRHYVFPGGMLPSRARFVEEAERAGLKATNVFSFGQDYARTLREWSARIESARESIIALGYNERFLRNWRFYLAMCAAAFRVERTDVVQIELAHA
ncbi:MAG TPA: cyclopropane-fatty-acyl-phospholipid synthase family protein [Rhizomicrobium sp.]|nr:cyclopropane-fatty-acyl-phospholipid synthase family protein [Rhizomicrobium sp.]